MTTLGLSTGSRASSEGRLRWSMISSSARIGGRLRWSGAMSHAAMRGLNRRRMSRRGTIEMIGFIMGI